MQALEKEKINHFCAYSKKDISYIQQPVIVLCICKKNDLFDTVKEITDISKKSVFQFLMPDGDINALPLDKKNF